ncbi:MAG: 50S ribosomal protein L9 [Elusimicrobia bacterium]|nr:50S ribosomal protein L9 [Elusimicrobiota bacterium]
MKVILRSSVENLGRTGDIKEVADGYGRNFLLPNRLAVRATPAALKEWEKCKDKRAKVVATEIASAKTLAEKLSGVKLSFTMPASPEGRLFGSVGKADILKSLKASGIEVGKGVVRLDAPIKTVGEHDVELRLQPEVSAKVKIAVVARE